MSVREFLAEHSAAGRAALVAAVLFVFGAVAGCSATTAGDEDRGIDHPARDAATVAEARAISLGDEINRLKRQQDELEGKRSDCMKLAASYRAKSAAVWSDPSVSERQRPALADQFNTLADEGETKADRYRQISDACASQIALLEAERHDQVLRARRYDDTVVPKSDSD
jgi:chorismate mutase